MTQSWWSRRRARFALTLFGLAPSFGCNHGLRIESAGPERGRVVSFEVLAAYSLAADRLQSLPERAQLLQSRRATERAGFLDGWQTFLLPGDAPVLDFSSLEVFFVATREWASCGVLPLAAVENATDALILRVPATGSYTCSRLDWALHLYADIEPVPPLVVRVVAVPRRERPPDVIRFGPDRAPDTARPPGAAPSAARGPLVTVPPIGEVTLAELEDGSKVWVAQHDGGEVTVLAGDFVTPASAVGGPLARHPQPSDAYVPSVWQPRARCFNSLFDEFGQPAFRSLRPLDRYEFTLDPDNRERVRIGRRLSGDGNHVARRRCVPVDDRVYSAYPVSDSSTHSRTVGGRHGASHVVALGVEFPLDDLVPQSSARPK